jgi:TPR repeat protein
MLSSRFSVFSISCCLLVIQQQGGLSYDYQAYAPGGYGGLVGAAQGSSTWTWFRKAAEGGEGWAQASLGESYLNGEGVPQNLAAARSWFKKSAEQENPLGQYRYGMVLVKGIGGARDVAAGAAFLAEAAAAGSEEALSVLAQLDW